MSNESTKEQPLNDAALLEAYTRGDQSSFRALVDRHAPWVFASALRQLRDNQLAEDATQAVFIILCQRAKSLTTHANLPGWLFNTTHYCVRAIQRAERRRHIHERRAAMQRLETQTAPPPFTESLDHAVARLPAKERAAVVMRFYQQMDFPELAVALGISELAARKRVTRAVETLRVRLGESAGAASLSIAALHGLPLHPTLLTASISQTALTAAAGLPVAASVTTITKGAIYLMATTQTKITAGIGIALLLLAGAGIATWSLSHSSVPAPISTDTTTSPSPNTPLVDPSPDATFEDVYKEPAGKDDVIRIQPPFVEGRLAFYETANPGQAKAIPKGPDAMLIAFDNGKPIAWGMTFGNGKGYSVNDLIDALLNVDAPNIEGPDTLLKKQIPGDFLISGIPSKTHQDSRTGLEKVLSEALGGKVTLTFQDVDRPVYVLHGNWMPNHADGTPYEPTDRQSVEIYGTALNVNSRIGGGGSGNCDELAKWVGKWIKQSVIIECPDAPKMISWHLNGAEDVHDTDARMQAHDADLVTKHLTEQTGLAVTQETRKIRRLFVDWQK